MPTTYDVESFTKLSALKQLAERTASEIAAASATAGDGIKYVGVSGNTISFWRDAAHTGEADFTVDFPSELFLDQTRTSFVPNFTFTAAAYPGAVNPSLDGKPVLVFAVKNTTDRTSGTVEDTFAYSFIDMSTLVDTYKPKAGNSTKILTINGYEIEVHISSAANNAITVENDGLHVNISGKADKVNRSTAAIAQNPYDETTQAEQYAEFNASYSLNGKIAMLDTNGNLKDSGAGIATTEEVTAMLNEVFGTPAQSGE